MLGPFIHNIDPIIGSVDGIYLWWYGFGYTIGFFLIHLRLRFICERIGLSLDEVYTLSIFLFVGVLVGGRFIEVVFYEWAFYGKHIELISAYWLGGMSSHGLMLGGTIGTLLFCIIYHKKFLSIADELVIPAALFLGLGRVGNFIDGQIVGSITDVWWAVKFPDAEGFRHPVVLYEGFKNIIVTLALLLIRKTVKIPGLVMACFLFLYGFPRIFIDIYRQYPTKLLGLATGQNFNILMSILAIVLFIYFFRKHSDKTSELLLQTEKLTAKKSRIFKQITIILILLFSLVIPSDWTQDIPAKYGNRHPGLTYSTLYIRINELNLINK